MHPLSLVVITFNEADRIRPCLQSALGVVDDIVVVDSLSTDHTVEIARSMGARVILQPFLGYVEQKAMAIREARYDRVLLLDADEMLSTHLIDSIREIKHAWSHDGYACNRLNHLGHRPLHHGGWYPDRKIRLFDRRKSQVGGTDPHDRIVMDPGTSTGRLKGDILHFTNKDLSDRIATINRFSTRAAAALAARGQTGSIGRLLAKPAFRFLSEYLLQGGLRDGLAGFLIARTSAQYVWLREAKLLENSGAAHPPIPEGLEAAYRSTDYRVEGFATAIRIGERNVELADWLEQSGLRQWAFITACNPNSVQLSASENAERNQQLREQVLHLPHLPGEGIGSTGDWPAEPSYLVAGLPQKDAVALGKRFGQIAVVGGMADGPAELWRC